MKEIVLSFLCSPVCNHSVSFLSSWSVKREWSHSHHFPSHNNLKTRSRAVSQHPDAQWTHVLSTECRGACGVSVRLYLQSTASHPLHHSCTSLPLPPNKLTHVQRCVCMMSTSCLPFWQGLRMFVWVWMQVYCLWNI